MFLCLSVSDCYWKTVPGSRASVRERTLAKLGSWHGPAGVENAGVEISARYWHDSAGVENTGVKIIERQ